MKLENQVCSLDLAKRLKELGVYQFERVSFFAWYIDEIDGFFSISRNMPGARRKNKNSFSAFTVAELGEMLRNEEVELPTYLDSTKEWVAIYETTLIGGASTEADARAKMIIFLLENKLIQV